MIEIIGIAIGILLIACIFYFIADCFSEQLYIVIPMMVLGTLCIAVVVVIASVITCHYVNTLGLNIGS